MTGTGIFLKNHSELSRKLKKMKEGLNEAPLAVALMIEGEAKKLCPVDTGRLRASIHAGKKGKGVAYVGTNVEYAPFVEFGTYKMRAKPYLRPAAKKVLSRLRKKGLFEVVIK